MQTKRKISFVFVFAAMALFMAHAFVPHCYHACHGFTATAHTHACSHHECTAHYSGETHFCHAHHHHGNEDDCLLNMPFLKSTDCNVKGAFHQLSHRSLLPDFMLPALCRPMAPILAAATHDFPDPPATLHSALWFAAQGLRAPPSR